jgi:hypothetical protein
MKFPQIGERQWVTIALFALAFFIIGLMAADASLRRDDLFKVLAQAIVLTAVVNGIVAFHFSSNKGNERATENTATALTTIAAVANAGQPATTQAEADGARAVADKADDAATSIEDRAKT